MMKPPKKREVEIYQNLIPWLCANKDGETCLKEGAPQEIKALYDEWLKKYIIPEREASQRGDLFY